MRVRLAPRKSSVRMYSLPVTCAIHMHGFVFFQTVLILIGIHKLVIPCVLVRFYKTKKKKIRIAVSCVTTDVFLHAHGSVGLWVCGLGDRGWVQPAQGGLLVGSRSAPRVNRLQSGLRGSSWQVPGRHIPFRAHHRSDRLGTLPVISIHSAQLK